MKRLILTSLCVLLFTANFAWADYITLPVKWSQLPVFENGFDYRSNHQSQITRADDFVCNDPPPIVAVRWWGSYTGETTPRNELPGFWKQMDISFHFSNLDDHPLSLPVNPSGLQTVLAQERWTGHFDAMNEPIYEYDAYLIEPFVQKLSEEYFIDIDDPFEDNWGLPGT